MNLTIKMRLLVVTLVILLAGTFVNAQTISVHYLASEPVLDGSGEDWANIKESIIPLRSVIPNKKADVAQVSIKSGVFKEAVYFFIQWEDTTEDNIAHKPYVWSDKENKYVTGPQKEDRLAIQFEMDGQYDANWFSGKTFKADMWHWKAYRSNPIGLVHDKMTVISEKEGKKAFKAKAMNGKTIYIMRPGDQGDKLYTSKKYDIKEKEMMPKYIHNPKASGSVTDVKAKGVWKDGIWSLELKRALNTGHGDDVVFKPGVAVKGGIAAFDHTSGANHDASGTLLFQF